MKQVLLMAVLAAGLLLTGCSKDSENNGMETKGNTEQKTQTLTKEQIVGVWRNGDYWVSFSEDGFMCGYLSDKCIVEGGYEVFQDQIIVVSDFFEHNITAFKITDVTDKTLECNVKYSEIDGTSLKDAEGTMTFTKSQEQPTACENEIIGKFFQFDSVYESTINYSYWPDYYKGMVNCHSEGMFNKDGSTTRHFALILKDGTPEWGLQMHMRDFYVYLAPYVYLIEFHDDNKYSIEHLHYILHPYDIQKMKVYFDSDGKINITES